MSTTIYYFSGTGNSLKIAKDLSSLLPESKLVPINKKLLVGDLVDNSEKIGLVFPVFAEGMPIMVEKFMAKLEVKKEAYFFGISNFGESAGGSLVQLQQLLESKGRQLQAAFEIKMPDNFNIFYPPAPKVEQQIDYKKQEEKMAYIAEMINASQRVPIPSVVSQQTGSWQRPPFDPRDADKKFWVDEKCNGCGICERVCPADNIVLKEKKPTWLHHCELCLACMQWCPQEAIQYEDKTTKWGRYQNPYIQPEELFS